MTEPEKLLVHGLGTESMVEPQSKQIRPRIGKVTRRRSNRPVWSGFLKGDQWPNVSLRNTIQSNIGLNMVLGWRMTHFPPSSYFIHLNSVCNGPGKVSLPLEKSPWPSSGWADLHLFSGP